MIKKLLVFGAGLLISASAFADYVLYQFEPDSPMSGYFVQREEDQSIAFFSLVMRDPSSGITVQYFPFFGDGSVDLTGASTRFIGEGPTGFSIYNDYDRDVFRSSFSIDFRRGAQGGYEYTAVHETSIWYFGGWVDFSGSVTGSLVRGIMLEGLAQELDSNGGYFPGVPPIVPTYLEPQDIPEPGTTALFLAGTVAALGVARRRKPAGSSMGTTTLK